MTDTPRADEVADYESAVRRHLADLPAPVREDLLADLETHLTEVAADLEPGATLAERLGSPEAYASELREAAEIDAAQGNAPAREKVTAALARVGGLADRYTVSAGAGPFLEFWKSLRPAWWVLRGLAGAGVVAVYVGNSLLGAYLFSAVTLFWLAVLSLVLIWCSVRLGTRSTAWRPAGRWALNLGGLALLWVAAASALGSTYIGYDYVDDGAFVDEYGYYGPEDVYPYSADGELLTGVYLLDEYGNPLYIGDPTLCSLPPSNPFETPTADDLTVEGPYDAMTAEPDVDLGYQYPLCVPEDEEPTADPSESAPPEGAATDDSSTTEESAAPTADGPTTE
ncbi:HAAS signaling domain-containing protein [Glycomyces harbinensis]|uniref:Uncharacterized protein n=1 Tax=Glycomyces harbinensis TaxID=58114 RepID=A0A1G6T1V2_9ACTN|nr:hypothetical protein [Glycomyces harbinensis]SDD22365.1 hypothetical protein SAMN05216270_102400 [Glycomyces harbinensis]